MCCRLPCLCRNFPWGKERLNQLWCLPSQQVHRITELLAGRISGGSYTNFQSMQDCWQHKIGSAVAVFFIQVLNRSKDGNPTCSLVTFSSVTLGLVKLQFVAAVPHSKSKQLRSLARKLNGNI